jgi:hypothetical protein
MSVLAAEAHGVTLDAERAQDGAQWHVEALEYGPLFDVQLEVGHGAGEPCARVERVVEVDAVLAQRIG